jgi:N-acetylglucosamine-6-sulfatase
MGGFDSIRRLVWRLARGAVATGLMTGALLAAPGSADGGGITAAKAAAATRPNIVLILTDDEPYHEMWAMPHVQSEIVRHGVEFDRGYVVNSLCCPSRTTILCGRYSHSTGVWTNRWPWGAYYAFVRNGDQKSTIATWLNAAGYDTALVGKFLNDYGGAAHAGVVPPGWDRWVALAMNNGAFYDYDLSVDGQIVHRGTSPADYSTNVLANQAVSFIRNAHGPLFLYFAPVAPHGPATPAPGDSTTFSGVAPWRPAAYNEANVSDKPGFAREAPMDEATQHSIGGFYRRQLQSLQAVDRGVDRIVRALSDTGRLHNTLLVFMSDNGYMLGEHRLKGKEYPYEESIRVPMVVRYDRLNTAARTDTSHLVLNLDIAPTFADAASVAAPGAQGRSLLPLLTEENPPWRHEFLVEHATTTDVKTLPPYVALHTERAMYVLYGNGSQEYYDLVRDPHEMVNQAGNPEYAKTIAGMRERIGALTGHRVPPGWRIATP